MSKALIKQYYRKEIYTDTDLGTFVKAGYITAAEASEIKKDSKSY